MTCSVHGQAVIEEDSIPSYKTNQVIKESSINIGMPINGKISTKVSLGNNIGSILGNNRLQSIAMFLPSIELRDFGGPGSLNMISIRGFGPMRNVILMDGIPLASSQTGVFDLGSLPVFPGQSIDIDMGGGSSFIGSGAMTGVISINTEKVRDTFFCSMLGGIGSFGEKSGRIQGGIGNKRASISANVDQLEYSGNFPVRFQPAGNTALVNLARENAGTSRLNAFVRGTYQQEEQGLSASMWTSFSRGKRGIPGPVLTGKIEDSKASLTEEEAMLAGSFQSRLSHIAFIHAKASVRAGYSLFEDPFAKYAGLQGASYLYSTKDVFSQLELHVTPVSDAIITSGVSFLHADLRGEMLQPFANGNPKRSSGALFSRIMTHLDDFEIDGGVRIDGFSDQQGPALSAHVSIVHTLLEGILLSAKITRDFRVPSFNELYYLNYGSQFLLPETSHGIDLGLTYMSGQARVRFSLYHARITDQILAIPISPLQWSARNIGLVWSSGIEGSLEYRIPAIKAELQANYAFKDIRDKSIESLTYGASLPYVPQHNFSVTLLSQADPFAYGVIVSGVGQRYGMQGALADSKLQPIVLINPYVEFRLPTFQGHLRFRGEIRNALNTDYQFILHFPLPGRSFVFLVGYAL